MPIYLRKYTFCTASCATMTRLLLLMFIVSVVASIININTLYGKVSRYQNVLAGEWNTLSHTHAHNSLCWMIQLPLSATMTCSTPHHGRHFYPMTTGTHASLAPAYPPTRTHTHTPHTASTPTGELIWHLPKATRAIDPSQWQPSDGITLCWDAAPAPPSATTPPTLSCMP